MLIAIVFIAFACGIFLSIKGKTIPAVSSFGVFILSFITMSFFIFYAPLYSNGEIDKFGKVQKRLENALKNDHLVQSTKTYTLRLISEANEAIKGLKLANQNLLVGVFYPDLLDRIELLNSSNLEAKEIVKK